jgi:regulator of sigma E protease
MPKSKGLLMKNLRGFLGVIVFVAVVYLIVRNFSVFSNLLLVLLGFGAVVLVHEFGHFIVAKLDGIKVEAFSIFMPPILFGVKRTERGFRFRMLPMLFAKEKEGEPDDGPLSLTIGKPGKAGETEYRVGLIPFGGFVKLLGQEDTGPVKTSDDPRSFANKPVRARASVIAAGVTFNVISAVIIFVIVFLAGIKLPPAVVGGILPDSPAEREGIKPGDEVIEIGGRSKDLDFSNIMIAAALSDVNEAVALKVRHEDGSEEDFVLVAERLPGESMRDFGIVPPLSLTVAEVSDVNALSEETGLLPGDRIKFVNGTEVRSYWQLEQIVQSILAPTVTVVAERTGASKETELVESKINLELTFANSYEVDSESDLNHIYSMVPRLRIADIPEEVASAGNKLLSLPRKIKNLVVKQDISEVALDPGAKLRVGDILLVVGDVENPTYKEMRDATEEYEGKQLPIKVLRSGEDGRDQIVTVTVVPKRPPGSDRVLIGIYVALDAEHPVVAKTISAEGGPARLQIPRGAQITAVAGTAIANFYDCLTEIRRNAGKRITIDYRIGDGTTGGVAVDVDADGQFICVRSAFAQYIPLNRMERLYQASGPIDAIAMGYRRTVMFIAQTYVTLRRLIGGLISPKHLIGPVGIIAFSYRIVVEQPLVNYAYFLGLISACIAVINFLPLPPFDGGLIVLMLIEKIKGSALSERTQGIVAYAAWALVGTLFLYVTFNDIVRSFFS